MARGGMPGERGWERDLALPSTRSTHPARPALPLSSSDQCSAPVAAGSVPMSGLAGARLSLPTMQQYFTALYEENTLTLPPPAGSLPPPPALPPAFGSVLALDAASAVLADGAASTEGPLSVSFGTAAPALGSGSAGRPAASPPPPPATIGRSSADFSAIAGRVLSQSLALSPPSPGSRYPLPYGSVSLAFSVI